MIEKFIMTIISWTIHRLRNDAIEVKRNKEKVVTYIQEWKYLSVIALDLAREPHEAKTYEVPMICGWNKTVNQNLGLSYNVNIDNLWPIKRFKQIKQKYTYSNIELFISFRYKFRLGKKAGKEHDKQLISENC